MKKGLIVFLGLFFLILPLMVGAQVSAVHTICNILEVIQNILLAIGLGIAIMVLIWGGVQYMTAGGDASKVDTARKVILNAIIGIAIILAAAFIIAVVQGMLLDAAVVVFRNPCSTTWPF